MEFHSCVVSFVCNKTETDAVGPMSKAKSNRHCTFSTQGAKQLQLNSATSSICLLINLLFLISLRRAHWNQTDAAPWERQQSTRIADAFLLRTLLDYCFFFIILSASNRMSLIKFNLVWKSTCEQENERAAGLRTVSTLAQSLFKQCVLLKKEKISNRFFGCATNRAFRSDYCPPVRLGEVNSKCAKPDAPKIESTKQSQKINEKKNMYNECNL